MSGRGMHLRTLARRGEQVAVLLIVLGVLGLVQPFTLNLVAYAFIVILAGMLLFMITSHL